MARNGFHRVFAPPSVSLKTHHGHTISIIHGQKWLSSSLCSSLCNPKATPSPSSMARNGFHRVFAPPSVSLKTHHGHTISIIHGQKWLSSSLCSSLCNPKATPSPSSMARNGFHRVFTPPSVTLRPHHLHRPWPKMAFLLSSALPPSLPLRVPRGVVTTTADSHPRPYSMSSPAVFTNVFQD